ncbi:hypothetical protein [Photobacterium galatheae]|uniref:Uncharacterized protein n=1 Tax=Photobacterium galatheae TaxID=1654360 RepID=A0A066RP60_9GAMM|nr:hypothetical protein [Photobacterium galatheae]KDM90911.1 hypothetical protein EA58_14220 [Photobacterium galatheae]MCM0149125.1 hypothetical protein [Photobacterium galatheae]
MEPSKDLVREYETKAKMATLCNQSLKLYARQKKSKIGMHSRMVLLLDAFIKEKALTFKYSILLSIIFSREYEEIKKRVLNGTYSLEHISTEKYWDRGASKIKLADAIFFAYTFYCEAFPQGAKIISNLDQMLIDNSDIDVVDVINQFVDG